MVINDVVVEQEDIISDHVLEYYENLYQQRETIQNSLINEVIPSLVSNVQNHSLVAYPLEKEMFDTINDMSIYNAPRPNRFGGIFFKSYWEIIKFVLVAFVQHFLRTGYLPEHFSFVHVILMP